MTASEVARKYIGQTEKPGNSGFNDEQFEAYMKAVGFEKGFAWCSLFAELVFKEAIPEKFDELDKLFSASTVQTFKNFRDAAYPIGYVPVKDWLVIWQMQKDGKPQWSGHAGIVSEVKSTWEFNSIEGNTNSQGDREGFEVAEMDRKIVAEVKNGLRVLGFIHISKPITLTIT
jgi:hypothetical protein